MINNMFCLTMTEGKRGTIYFAANNVKEVRSQVIRIDSLADPY